MTNLPPIGSRIYYTGDMANASEWTTVDEHIAATRFAGPTVHLKGEDGRHFMRIGPAHWTAGPGRRFVLETVYNAERAAAMADAQMRYAAVAGPFMAARAAYPRMEA